MTRAEGADRRQMYLGFAVLALIPAVISIGQAVWHLAVRDELWGLAVGWKGGSGLVLLGLSWWCWRRAGGQRRRTGLGG